MDKKSKIQLIEKKYLAIIIGIIFAIGIISVILNSLSLQIGNNVTIIVEIGVGIIIAIVVYAISRKSEVKIEEKVEGLFDIVKTREEFRKKQVNSIKEMLLSTFNKMEDHIDTVLEFVKAYEKSKDKKLREHYKKLIISECNQMKNQAVTNLDDPAIVSSEYFDVETIAEFKSISLFSKKEPIFDKSGTGVDVNFCNKIKKIIKFCIEEINKDLGKESITGIPAKIPLKPKFVSMSVSADRTVYPLDSTIHVRANIQSIIPEEEILFEIFNSNGKSLQFQEIDPTTYDLYPDLKDVGIYQVSFKMMGDDWIVGEVYTVKATHGPTSVEDTFSIDQRKPVVQSDKSVYIIGSDMIITVIDPDADKDNQIAEYVGDREESKLVIESPYGKIDGYRLKETGDSTGIFQGIIRILEIERDGTVIPQTFDGKTIDKIQGTGIEDGFIGGAPGDELTVTYTNRAGTATLNFFISNFGVSVELDQKVYTWTDKVHITIVAPDLIRDSEKVEKIGNNDRSKISIHSRKAKLENYELVETNPGSGIFVGEVRLTGFSGYDARGDNKMEKTMGVTSGKGPNDGLLECDNDDGLNVILKTKHDEFNAGALIRWNIGEIQWEQPNYKFGSTGMIVIVDPDLNLNPNLVELIPIRIWSDSDPVGVETIAIETGNNTGIFVASLQFGNKTDKSTLKASVGDTVTAQYVDRTLPDPYNKGQTLDITATTTIR